MNAYFPSRSMGNHWLFSLRSLGSPDEQEHTVLASERASTCDLQVLNSFPQLLAKYG